MQLPLGTSEFEYQDAGLNWVKVHLTLTEVEDCAADVTLVTSGGHGHTTAGDGGDVQPLSPGGILFGESEGKNIKAWAPAPVRLSIWSFCWCACTQGFSHSMHLVL